MEPSPRREDPSAPPVISRRDLDAVVFDMDGVVTDTARVHAVAWQRLFDEYLDARERRGDGPVERFTPDDYLRSVDGKPRYDGVASFLRSRGIELSRGEPDDPPDRETVCGLGNRKDGYFREALRTGGADAYPTTVALVRELRARGFRVAVISASRNAREVLDAAGVLDDFETRVDGVVADELGLAGKPDPAVFVEAVRRLGVDPGRAAVVEDARAGVEAGRRGRFGLVVGVDRVGQSEALLAAGADVVVHDLGELVVADGPPARPITELESARSPSARAAIRDRLAAGTPAVFLDFDGVLTPIIEDPDAVALSPEMRAGLERLARTMPVAIVSGRDRDDVAARVGIDDIVYAGSHGFDITAPGGIHFEHPGAGAARPLLEQAATALEAAVGDVEGTLVERKRYAVALHYRRTPPDQVDEVLAAYERVADAHPGLARSGGKMVVELRPKVEWHKGRALRWIGSEVLGVTDLVPVYVGDDLTDEDAFREIADDGIAVVVRGGDHPTEARWSLADVDEVGDFLAALAETVQESR